MAEPVLEPVAPPVSLAEYKARKAEAAAGTAAPPAGEKAPAVPKGETAGTSASPPQESQEKTPKPPRAKNATERAAELKAAGRHAEAEKILADDAEKQEFESWKKGKADRDRDAEELRRLRSAPPAAVAHAAPAAPPAAAPSSAADKPKLSDFLAKPENATKTHDQVVEEWEEAVYDWRTKRSKVETEAEKRQSAFIERQSAVKSAHPDYDAVTSGENFQRTLVALAPQAVAAAAHELPHGVEVLYRLAKDADECRRIAGLSPTSQIIELGVMSRQIAQEASGTKPPEKTPAPPPVSRTPPPTRSLGGIAPGELTENGKPPTSLADHKARKAARAS